MTPVSLVAAEELVGLWLSCLRALFYAGIPAQIEARAGAEPRHFVSDFARLTTEASMSPSRNFAINGGQN